MTHTTKLYPGISSLNPPQVVLKGLLLTIQSSESRRHLHISPKDPVLPPALQAICWLNLQCIWIIYDMNKFIHAKGRCWLLGCSNANRTKLKLETWRKWTHNNGKWYCMLQQQETAVTTPEIWVWGAAAKKGFRISRAELERNCWFRVQNKIIIKRLKTKLQLLHLIPNFFHPESI